MRKLLLALIVATPLGGCDTPMYLYPQQGYLYPQQGLAFTTLGSPSGLWDVAPYAPMVYFDYSTNYQSRCYSRPWGIGYTTVCN